MRDLVTVVAATLFALGILAAVVIYGGDATITVPPPESIAEQFSRHVAARRYDRALTHVDDNSRITLTTVRLRGDALQARGEVIDQVEGEPGFIEGNRAAASAVLITERAGPIRYAFRLVRREGLWKIVEWAEMS